MRVGLFVDLSNLYYCIQKKFNRRKLNYEKYRDFIAEIGDLEYMIAYGAQIKDEANLFFRTLRNLGFEVKWKHPKFFVNKDKKNNTTKLKHKADWDVGIVIDVVRLMNKVDIIVIGSADGDMRELVCYAKDKGKTVVAYGTNISKDLREVCDKCIEIPTSMLEGEHGSV